MKRFLPFIAMLLMATLSYPAYSITAVDVAKAYIQAVTGGSGSKVAGTIDYDAIGCTPATVFDDTKCQKVVFNGKDGKALLIESITKANVAQLVPLADVQRVYQLGDPAYSVVRELFYLLSTKGDNWFPTFDGTNKAKGILQAHLQSSGAGGMYGTFQWPFDAASAATAKVTSVGVDFMISTLPTAASLSLSQSPLYFWALQTDFSDMAYPPGFTFPADFRYPDPSNPDLCRSTTAAWGHVGLQYSKNDPSNPNATQRRMNWGGGGQGSGVADYGCGGSDVSDVAWQASTWYQYRVARGAKLGPTLWEWLGSVTKKGAATPIYSYKIFGGEYVTWVTSWSELINVRCADPKHATQWANPWMGNAAGKFRVGTISFDYGNDGCLRSKEAAANTCTAKWTQNQGAAPPVGHAAAALLRQTDFDQLNEGDCVRNPDATEISIAKAYIQAISGGTGAKQVSAAIDYTALGCTPNTVYDDNSCQRYVLNARDGKTILMEAISTSADGIWSHTNIQTLIPLDAMQRIKGDSAYSQALSILTNMSTPNNTWYPYLDGAGKAKETLAQYMNSVP